MAQAFLSTLPDEWAPPKARARFGPGTLSHTAEDRIPYAKRTLRLAAMPMSSEFKLELDKSVADAALAIVPDELRSTADDDAETLAARIAQTQFFDELDPLAAGGRKGKKRLRLNSSMLSQTRRKAWSVEVKDAHLDGDGQLVRTMYAYGKPNSRIRTAVHATPMPWPIFELGAQCQSAARHLLSGVCASSPPNHCQLLGYYGLFNTKTGRHKDDHCKQDFVDVMLGLPFGSSVEDAVLRSKGAMAPGSDVLIYSSGPLPVLFSWSFTREDLGHFVGREMYEIHPYLQIPLCDGSLFVFKAVDIDWRFVERFAKPGDYRFALTLYSKCVKRPGFRRGGMAARRPRRRSSSAPERAPDPPFRTRY